MTAGNRLKAMVSALKLRQQDVADAIGINRSHISHLMNDKYEISKTIALALKAQYQINPDWLLTGEGEMFLPGKSPLDKTDGSGTRPPAEINCLGVIEGNVETYPQVDIIEKISRTGWWRKLSSVKKNIVAAVDEIEDQEYLATVDKGLRGKVESDRFQKAIEEAVDKHVPGVRQKGEAG